MPNSAQEISLAGVKFSRLSDYFGLWSIEPTRGLALFDRVSNTDLLSHIADSQRAKALRSEGPTADDEGPRPLTAHLTATAGQQAFKIAVIEAAGTLMKHESSLDSSTSTVRLRREITQAANDPTVAGILLVIDSPGGTTAGTADLGTAVRNANQKKPVYAFAEDLAASAAYWIGCQAERFFANDATALIGSIGTFIGTYDMSGRAGMTGVRAKVYKTGSLKGTGFPGTEITPEQDAYLQSIVDESQQHFVAAVAAGRKMSAEQVQQVASGGVFVAPNALKLGLIDGIQTFDATLQALAAAASKRRPTSLSSQSQETDMKVNAAAAQAEQTQAAAAEVAAENKTAETKADEAAGTTSAATSTDTSAETPTQTEGQRFLAAFGDAGGRWYAEGKSFVEAQQLHAAALKAENDELKAKLATQGQVVAAIRGEAAPVSSTPEASERDAEAAIAKQYAGVLPVGLARFAASLKMPVGDVSKN